MCIVRPWVAHGFTARDKVNRIGVALHYGQTQRTRDTSLLTPVQGTSSGLSLQGAPFPPKLVSRLLRVGDAGKRKYFRNWKY